MGSRYETYLFDLDGTLIDSIDLIFRAYRHAATRHLSTEFPDSVWREGLGTPLRQQFRAVCQDEELIEVMVATYREYFLEHHDTSIRLYPFVGDMLEALVERGVRLGIVTSKPRFGAERGLRATGILDYFQTIVSADEVGRPKPDPEPVRAALERLDADPGRTEFIGDSPHDIAAGLGAGVETAGVLWGPFAREVLSLAGAHFLLSSPPDVLAL